MSTLVPEVRRRRLNVDQAAVDRLVGCEGKLQFSSPDVAAKIIRRQGRKRKRSGNPMVKKRAPYKCRHCGFFHIGG